MYTTTFQVWSACILLPNRSHTDCYYSLLFLTETSITRADTSHLNLPYDGCVTPRHTNSMNKGMISRSFRMIFFFDNSSLCQKESRCSLERSHISYFASQIMKWSCILWVDYFFNVRVESCMPRYLCMSYQIWSFGSITWSIPGIHLVNTNLELMWAVRSQEKKAVILQTKFFSDLCVWLHLWISLLKYLSYSEIAKPSCLIKELKLLNFELTGPVTKYYLQKVC